MANYTDNLIRSGLQHFQAGELPQAEAVCRKALLEQPQNAEALHLLGMLALRVNKFDASVHFFRRAIAANPSAAHYYNNLGVCLFRQGRIEDAIICYGKALEMRGEYRDARGNLAAALREQARQQEQAAPVAKVSPAAESIETPPDATTT